MTNETRMTNDKEMGEDVFGLCASSLIRNSSFELGHFLTRRASAKLVEAKEFAARFLREASL